MQTYIRPLLSSQLLSILFLLCLQPPFILFNSDTRDLPPQKLRELNLPLASVIQMKWINRHMGIAADRKGCKKNSNSCYFCTETASQTSLEPAPSLYTINLPPQGSQLHSDKQSRGSFCHMLPTSHLGNTLKWKAYGSHSCGQSCWDPKKTVKAGSSISYPEGEDSGNFLAMQIHGLKPQEQLWHPHCRCCMS